MDIPLSFIHAGQVTPDVLALFDINRPTMPRAFSVLEGLEPRGQASQRWTRCCHNRCTKHDGRRRGGRARSGATGAGSLHQPDLSYGAQRYGHLDERGPDLALRTASAEREVYRIASKPGYDDAEYPAVFGALRH